MNEDGRNKQRKRVPIPFPPAPQFPSWLDQSQVEGQRQELEPGFPSGWKEPSYSSHHQHLCLSVRLE